MFELIRSRYALAAVAVATTVMGLSAAMADTTTSQTSFDVKVSVTAGCSITNTADAVNFGSTTGVSPKPSSQTKTATIICTDTTPYDFHVTTVNGFKMKHGSTSDTIPYTIKDNTNVLGSTAVTSGFSRTGSGAAQTISFTFEISAWNQSLPYKIGDYTDTVTLSVDF